MADEQILLFNRESYGRTWKDGMIWSGWSCFEGVNFCDMLRVVPHTQQSLWLTAETKQQNVVAWNNPPCFAYYTSTSFRNYQNSNISWSWEITEANTKTHLFFTFRPWWHLKEAEEVDLRWRMQFSQRDSQAPLSVVRVFLRDWSVSLRNVSPGDRLSHWFRVKSTAKRSFHCDGSLHFVHPNCAGAIGKRVVGLQLTLWNTTGP